MDRYEEILKQYWGYDGFRGIQHDIIESIDNGHDTLGLMPTGGGKSITFQVPALAKEGLCIVLTPLIALMKDQVIHLKQKGIKAAAIYTGMTHEQILTTLDNAVFDAYKLLYISPERLGSELFQKKLAHMRVSFICVDEAHCISQWGYDFRPSYLNIKQVRKILPDKPILALTATATPDVVTDIQKQLEFREERVFRMSFERSNIAYKVKYAEDKLDALRKLLIKREGSAIVYCRNRKLCKEYSEIIQTWNITSTFYHAGLENSEKDKRQHDWQNDDIRVITATNAFGMGIDKADVRLVVHIGTPDSIEEYFQEAGRAGRDGEEAEAILLYNGNDIANLKRRVSENFPDRDTIRNIYSSVCNFLQIPIGYGIGVRREFNLMEFCKLFRFGAVYVESSLDILTKAGYVNYTDSEDGVSRVKFTLERDELYRLNSDDAKQDSIIKCMFRNHSGLFIDYVPISESYIAKSTNMSEAEVYQNLIMLSKAHILDYIPRKNIPHIAFTRERQEEKYITIPKEILEKRRDVYKSRIDYMIEYLKEQDKCRQNYLLRYFGEKNKIKCRKCDVCIKKEKEKENSGINKIIKTILSPFKEEEISEEKRLAKQNIINQIKEAGHIFPFDLNFDDIEIELAQEIIAEMDDKGEIKTDDLMRIYIPDKR